MTFITLLYSNFTSVNPNCNFCFLLYAISLLLLFQLFKVYCVYCSGYVLIEGLIDTLRNFIDNDDDGYSTLSHNVPKPIISCLVFWFSWVTATQPCIPPILACKNTNCLEA